MAVHSSTMLLPPAAGATPSIGRSLYPPHPQLLDSCFGIYNLFGPVLPIPLVVQVVNVARVRMNIVIVVVIYLSKQ
jgi:hypothetical protein